MFDSTKNTTTDSAVALLIHYCFDLGSYTVSELIDHWLQDYPASWVCQSVIEALYQGRYKAISVEQILAFWKRRGQAVYHYNHEFERLVCGKFPQALSGQPSNRDNAASSVAATIGSSHEVDHPDVVAVSGTDKKSSVELIDRTAYVLPVTNQMDKKPSQKNTHQASENDQSKRSLRNNDHRRIKQFTPDEDGSDFYSKLKTIAAHKQNAPN